MISKIKKHINPDSRLYALLQIFSFLKNVRLRKISGSKKKYPLVIQLPITYKCNSKCTMCNIWKMDSENEMNLETFQKAIKSKLFKKVIAVGINGGEPSLLKQLPEYVDALLTLPEIKSISLITHGFNHKLILNYLKQIYQKTQKTGVLFNVSVSLDGVGSVHNKIRGLEIFKKTEATIDEINTNRHLYCDVFEVACTVIKQNVYHLPELAIYAEKKNLTIKYRLGISNKRIESNKILDNFSIMNNEKTLQTAKEFFYSQIGKVSGIYDKFKYFSFFYFLEHNLSKRLLGCYWQNKGVTLDSKGNLYYCAVESEQIGNIIKGDGTAMFFSEENLAYRKNILKNKCNQCIHDYAGKPELRNIMPFIKELINRNLFSNKYKFLSKF